MLGDVLEDVTERREKLLAVAEFTESIFAGIEELPGEGTGQRGSARRRLSKNAVKSRERRFAKRCKRMSASGNSVLGKWFLFARNTKVERKNARS